MVILGESLRDLKYMLTKHLVQTSNMLRSLTYFDTLALEPKRKAKVQRQEPVKSVAVIGGGKADVKRV